MRKRVELSLVVGVGLGLAWFSVQQLTHTAATSIGPESVSTSASGPQAEPPQARLPVPDSSQPSSAPVAHSPTTVSPEAGLDTLRAAGFSSDSDQPQYLGRHEGVTGRLMVPTTSGRAATYMLATQDRDALLERVAALERLIGESSAARLYSTCQFEDLRAAEASRALCESRFHELETRLSREQSDAIQQKRDELCRELPELRAALKNFTDVAERQLDEHPEMFSDMARMTRSTGLLDLFCRSE